MHKCVLKLAIIGQNAELRALYEEAINKHNQSVRHSEYPNSGFDLFVPEQTVFSSPEFTNANLAQFSNTKMVSMGVKAEMIGIRPSAYYLYPRSSISKTPLMLANHVGIIDSGYRGPIIGAFRNLSLGTYTVEKHTRLLQICHPTLEPFYVELVEESDLSETERGSGGFGSTG